MKVSARDQEHLPAGRDLHVDGSAGLSAGLSAPDFRIRRSTHRGRPDRATRLYYRRERRSLGGALHGRTTARRQPEDHRLQPAEGGAGGVALRQCESEATKQSSFLCVVEMDCFAEPVIGRRFTSTRWLAMTVALPAAGFAPGSTTPSRW